MKRKTQEQQTRNFPCAIVEVNGKKRRAYIFQNEEEMIRHREMCSDIEALLSTRQLIKDFFTKGGK